MGSPAILRLLSKWHGSAKPLRALYRPPGSSSTTVPLFQVDSFTTQRHQVMQSAMFASRNACGRSSLVDDPEIFVAWEYP
jgi:hypothetical protein